MPRSSPLDTLLARHDTWRGRDYRPRQAVISSGDGRLDRLLGGGWPRSGLSELLTEVTGVGELQLLLPVLAAAGEHWRVWLDPPYCPYAPGLAAAGVPLSRLLVLRSRQPRDWLWAAQRCLQSGATLLAWAPAALRYSELRKLQLAASQADGCGFLFRASRARRETSPAVLRLHLAPRGQQLAVTLLKFRGQAPGQQALLSLPPAWVAPGLCSQEVRPAAGPRRATVTAVSLPAATGPEQRRPWTGA